MLYELFFTPKDIQDANLGFKKVQGKSALFRRECRFKSFVKFQLKCLTNFIFPTDQIFYPRILSSWCLLSLCVYLRILNVG
jgi:hypothetical protein